MTGLPMIATHVGWPMLMPLALKLAIAEELLRRAYPMELLSDQPEVLELWEGLNRLMLAIAPDRKYRSDHSADADPAAIDTYFETVGRQFVSQYGDLNSPIQLRLFVAAVASAVQLKPCAGCVAARPPQTSAYVCRWTMKTWTQDQGTLSTAGECIEPVSRLFRTASQVARHFYQASIGSLPPYRLILSTSDEFGRPSLSSWIDGRTIEVPGSPTRLIRISFGVKDLRPVDFLSLFYVLMHECVAHGYCGVTLDHPDASLANNFHDGLMDWVALALCEHVGEAGLDQTDLVRRYQTAFEEQAWHVFDLRHNPSAFSQSCGSTERQEGRRAFRVLLKVFQDVGVNLRSTPMSEAEALLKLIGLSIRVNASSIPHAVRAVFVARVVMLLWRDNPDDRKSAMRALPELLLIVGSYFETADAELFVSQVMQLPLRNP